MQSLLKCLLLLSWALWLGGLVGVLVSVTTIFAAFGDDRTGAGNVAAQVFARFEPLALIAAGVAVASAIGLFALARSISRTTLLVVLLLATAGAAGSRFVISPRIDAMREAKQTKTDDFKRLHGTSMMLYVSVTGLLAVAGLVIPSAFHVKKQSERS